MNEEFLYWNPVIETLSLESLLELQFMKFKRILDWVYQHSPLYHRIYKEEGKEPGDIKMFDDIKRIPKIEKI